MPSAKKVKVKRQAKPASFELRLVPANVFSIVAYGMALVSSAVLVAISIPVAKDLANAPLQQVLGSGTFITTQVTAISPQEAAKAALTNGIISEVEKELTPLTEYTGQPAYKIEGKAHHKYLGFIDLTLRRKVWVTADGSKMIASEQSLVATFIAALSW